jgi:hypothetical protein
VRDPGARAGICAGCGLLTFVAIAMLGSGALFVGGVVVGLSYIVAIIGLVGARIGRW